ncbi:helix-turn-helix domain-containing protein [Zhihengliuella halotolerans]|uniref:helix-turn-helix domain-containing protein n=1 Tax=Zhihengliuella halotolerans TaxID=370736 RepID=UPI0035715C94
MARVGGRKQSTTSKEIAKAQALYDDHRFTMTEIARVCEASPATLYRYLEIEGGKWARFSWAAVQLGVRSRGQHRVCPDRSRLGKEAHRSGR